MTLPGIFNGTNDSLVTNNSDSDFLEMPPLVANLLMAVNVYNGFMYVLGMSGNMLVLYVVCRYSKMHTVTNFFILSLAVADLLYLFMLPFVMVTMHMRGWIFGDLYCRIFYSVTTINQFASSFFLMVMSADRYFAICHPIRSSRYRTAKAAIVVCSITWATSVILMIPVFIYSGEIREEFNPNRASCMINWPGVRGMAGMQAFTLYCLILGFAFPLLLIVAFYWMVLRKIRHLGPRNSTQTQNETRKRSHRRVTAMVLAVITAYVVCWTPYWIANVMIIFVELDVPHLTIVMSCIQALCYTSSGINPVLYAMLSENFKKSFAAACCGRRADFDRSAIPEASVFQRSRTLAGSLRRRNPSIKNDEEDEEDSPGTHNTDVKVEETSFLRQIPQNGKAQSSPMRYRNGDGKSNPVSYQQEEAM